MQDKSWKKRGSFLPALSNARSTPSRMESDPHGDWVTINKKQWVTTLHPDRAAGFYGSVRGPLPFAFGPVPPEAYRLIRLRPASFPSHDE